MPDTGLRHVIPDTNFIVSMLRQRRDLDEEIKTAIPSKVRILLLDLVLLELERLARKGPSNIRTWANASLSFLKERHYPIAEHLIGPSDIDASIITFALAERVPTAVATLDIDLRTALRALGVPTIQLRKRYGLIVDAFSSSHLNKGESSLAKSRLG